MRNILCNIINPVSIEKAEYLTNHVLSLDREKILSITSLSDFEGEYEDYSDCLALPGFIDLHVHLSQYRIRGHYYPALLPWLKQSVFPEESKSRDLDYAQKLSEDFFIAQLRAGTTCSVIYTAPYREAADAAFFTAQDMGIRALIGMTLMDQNSPENMLQTTDYAITNSIELHEKWQTDLLGYIFTPRFAPTCTRVLMQEIGSYASGKRAYIQTHLSENQAEIAWVKELFQKESYTDVYKDFGILTSRTLLGHAIHLSDQELGTIKASGAKITHCPDSNFYLKSGEYPLKRIQEAGIPFGLGSDVGAGTSLNMLYHTKMMNFRQSSDPIMPEEMLYRVTLGSAKLLELEDRIGSLKPGKDADIVFLSPPPDVGIDQHSLSQICFYGEEFRVKEVIVAGRRHTF